MANFFTEMWDRVWSDTPAFFKKLQIIGGSLVAMKGSLLAIPGLPSTLQDITTQAAIIGGVMVVIGQFACSDKNPPPPPSNQ